MRLSYRVSQFWNALSSAPLSEDLDHAQCVLTPACMRLFQRMQPSEQAHSLRIFRQLLAQHETDKDLLAAALLHDVGKIRCPLRIWERVLVVLGNKLIPDQAKKWGQGAPHGWKRPFVVARQHPAWGAELAEQAGASPMTVALIRRHQDALLINPSHEAALEDQLLMRLQRLDNES